MRRKFGFLNSLGKKNIFLAAVALLLVMLVAVGSTISWIEEVSQVDFDNTKGQQTPSKIGKQNNILKSDMITREKNAGNNEDAEINTISLSDYFSKSGDMHLSPCYSDGEKFYFPKEGASGQYRAGTKDDANVNYLSATFRITSQKATSSYWFEKSDSVPFISFKKGTDDVNNSQLEQFLRCSITIDGSTNVYALNSNGDFYTVSGISDNSPDLGTGRSIEKYIYYPEVNNDNAPEGYYKDNVNKNNKPNQGAGNNLNGNTLFTVNSSAPKTVTVKIWLEYNSSHSAKGVDLAAINLNLVSSWSKTRRIYVKDATENQQGYPGAKWLTSTVNVSGTNVTPKLYWALKDNLSTNWQLQKNSGTDYYYVDVPAVYNNTDVVLFRSANFTSSGYNQTRYGTTNFYYLDKWETKFPDTFHSETYTVCTNVFGTWEESPSKVYFLNSCNFETPRAYMWDTNFGFQTGIVENATWPGVKLTNLKEKVSTTNTNNKFDYYTFYYTADYSNIIFSNGLAHGGNWEHQSQDITQVGNVQGKTFDMTSLMWYTATPSSHLNLPKYADFLDTYIDTSLATGHNDHWTHLNLCYGGTPSNNADQSRFNGTTADNLMCRFYSKYGASGNDVLKLVLHVDGTTYKAYKDSYTLDVNSGNASYELFAGNDYNKDLEIKNVANTAIYSIYVTKITNGYRVTLHKD